MKKVFVMVQNEETNEAIEAYAKEQITYILSQVFENERVTELFEELEERAQEAQQFQDFNLEEFRDEVKNFIQKYKKEYKEANVEEKTELLSYMLGSNLKIDELLQ
jgi:endonuclease III